MGVNLFQKGISHRWINEPQHILSQSPLGAGSSNKTSYFSGNVRVPGRLHNYFLKTITLFLRQPMSLVIKLIGFNIRIF